MTLDPAGLEGRIRLHTNRDGTADTARPRHRGESSMHSKPTRRPIGERFWPKVRMTHTCWIWTAAVNASGYGQISSGGHNGRPLKAHRVAYELLVGPIPDGLVIDHLCKNTRCVNPAHLEVVTHRVNILRSGGPSARQARKTHCDRGHEFTPENTRITPQGWRRCLTCVRAYRRGATA